MKNNLYLFIFFILASAFPVDGYAQVPPYVPSANLIGWYPFNGNAVNACGTGKNGSVMGATLTTDRYGTANSAYYFNGSSAHITIDTTFFNVGWSNFTVSCWLNSDTLSNPYNSGHSQIMFNTIPHNGIALAYNWGATSKYSMWANSTPGVATWNIMNNKVSTANVSVHTWKHVVMRKVNDTGYDFFINGAFDKHAYSATTAASYYCKLVLGRDDSSASTEAFFGKLDDYGIWNRALTHCEIAGLYASASTVITGPSTVSVGSTITLADSVAGGTWSSSSTSIATVGSVSGIVTGISLGTATITYSYGECYVTTSITVNSSCTTLGIINTIAGNGTTYSGDGGAATAAGISQTYPVATDNSGNVYISNWNVYRIRKVNSSGTITTIAGTGSSGFSGDGGPATAAAIGSCYTIASDASGNIYLADYYNYRIRKIDASGAITTIAGTGGSGFSGDGGSATTAQIGYPLTIALDGSGNIYFYDQLHYRIRKINGSGIISTIAGIGTAGYSGDGGQATAAQINATYGLAADYSGNVYFGDGSNYRIRKISTSGIISTYAGTGTSGYTGDGGPAALAQIYQPGGIAIDPSGNLFFTNNSVVRKINSSGIIFTIAGTGTSGFSGDGGPATAAQFSSLHGISLDNSDNIYIVDSTSRVRKIYSASNHPPLFTGGTSQTLNVCQNAGPVSTNSILAIIDSDMFQAETWSLLSGPSHGSASATFTSSSTGGSLTPTGLTYTPTSGYTGYDTFRVTVNDGCLADTISIYVTVTASSASITGTLSVCTGTTTTLSCSSSGGSWSSGNTAIAIVGSSTGVVTGVSPGTAIIYYSFSSGCPATAVITVNPVPNILGFTAVYVSRTTLLISPTTGGIWSSSNTSIATVGSSSGIVSGVAAGYAMITYTLPTGCFATVSVLVRAPSVCPNIITTIIGSGTGGFGGDGGPATAALMYAAWGLARDTAGNIYISDFTNNRVRKITPAGIITTFAGNGSGYSGDGGPATAAGISGPTGIAVYGSDVYIAEVYSSRIRKVNAAGIITTYAGTGTAGYSGDGGPATAAKISNPNGLGVDLWGNIYIPDQSTNRVRKVNTSGIISLVAGSGIGGYMGDGGAATLARLNLPNDVTADAYGNIYFAEFNNNIIRKVNTSGIISTFAGTGVAGFLGDGGPASAARLHGPAGVLFDQFGTLYLADADNYRIRTIDNTGIITSIAGNGGGGFSGDGGPPLSAQINRPCRSCTDPAGNVYIADMGNYRIRKINSSNRTPLFTGGHTQTFNVCQNSGPNAINSLLAVIDTDAAQAETWVSLLSPVHGTLSAAYTTTSTGSLLTPTGLTYTPTTGYNGLDSFKVRIYDCAGLADTTTIIVTVNPTPSPITGTLTMCIGNTTTLADATPGGTWSSGAISVAIIGSATGIVTGASVGMAVITYTLGTGCFVTATVTVNAPPGPVTGIATTCIGGTTTLYDAGGGTWSSGATAIATIGSSTGVVTGIATGSAIMTYSMGIGCTATFSITVYPVPTAILGTPSVCTGATTTLTDAVTGGYWTSGTAGVATIGSASGIVTGISAGTSVITYSVAPSAFCSATVVFTVNPAPGTIAGTPVICAGMTTPLFCTPSGGTWSSGALPIATVGSSTGVMTGVSAGVTSITYTMPGGCSTNMAVTVTPGAGSITGSTHICLSTTATLSDTATGGAWSSSNPSIAYIDAITGVVTGVSAGTATITYTVLSSGCIAISSVTIDPLPAPITGSAAICMGSSGTLTDATTGGTWSSGTTSVATIGSVSGIATGLSVGTTVITYSLSAGCSITRILTVNTLPNPIGGPPTVCVGTTITLTDSSPGGTWSKSNTNVNIGSLTGIVTGITAGTTVITYTLSSGCFVTRLITINTTPGPITGGPVVCIGATTLLSDPTPGGIWSSGSATATIGSATGIVTGVATGVAIISYSIGAGCVATTMITISALPAVITGPGSVCVGALITLADATPSGTWSTTGSTASIGASTGITTGISTGTAIITYQAPSGCRRTTTITINPLPSPITGPTALCVGASITEVCPGGGTWSSSTTSVATIGSTTGVVTGFTTGTTTITYTLPTGCRTNTVVTVSSSPTAIIGPSTVCVGATALLTDGIPGGSWFSSTGTAVIGSLTGAVTGISAGTTTITYSLGTGCTVTRPMTVNAAPAPITGLLGLCTGATTALSDATPAGTWSSGSTGIATISSTGVVSGITTGTATITYAIGSSGCAATAVVTVNAAPGPIAGPGSVCIGATVTETNATAGGIWTTTATNIIIGSSSGMVTGISGGTAIITYSIGACRVTRTVTVTAISDISGAAGVCIGATTTLTCATPGGTWTCTPTTIATVGATTGTVTGVATGVAFITYTISSGCFSTKAITVNAGPTPIGGTASACIGSTSTLTNGAGGGTWTSSNLSIATVGSVSGMLSGVAAGTATITYSLGSGCTVTRLVTVYPNPVPIVGVPALCLGSSATWTDASPGGTWTSGVTSVATIGATTGTISGVTTGTAIITYTLPTGCITTKVITVNSGPAAITGTPMVCVGATTPLADAVPGGTWTSGSANATVGSASGIVTGVVAGTATITYSLGSGCLATMTVTINPLPAPITGTASVCIGATTILSDAVTGGVWTSGATGVASIGASTGIVTGITAGTAIITYTPGAGCSITREVTVNPLPLPVTGSATLCVGNTTPLSSATAGGTWASSNIVIATVGSSSGIVTGVNTGTSTISYTLPTGCRTTRIVTVNVPPPGITGSSAVCVGQTITLSDAAPGGTWSSSNTALATVSSTGVVTGVAGGSVIISYTVSSGCSALLTVIINSVPPITGLHNLCAWGDTLTVHDANPAGSFSSSLATVLNLGGGNGRITAHAPGTATVTYTLTTGCFTTLSFTVNPLPLAITGSMSACIGATTTLFEAVAGGTWSSSATTVATVGSSTGIVTGITAGTSYIRYTLPTGCKVDTLIHVYAPPAPITVMSSSVLVGVSTVYGDPTPGGIWNSSNTAIATVGAGTGIVTGISVGVATIRYTLPTGCYSTRNITVIGMPSTNPGIGHITVFPNPNKGDFTVMGSIGTAATLMEPARADDEILVEVTDMLGRLVYKTVVRSHNGYINERISLGSNLSNGMYNLTLRSGGELCAFHLMIEQ